MSDKNLGAYIKFYDFMFQDLNLKGAEVLVYALIHSYTRDYGGVLSNNAGIASRLNMSERSLYTILNKLTADGKVKVVWQISDSGKRERVLTADYVPGKRLVRFGPRRLVLLTARDYGELVYALGLKKMRAAFALLEEKILEDPDFVPKNDSHKDEVFKMAELIREDGGDDNR